MAAGTLPAPGATLRDGTKIGPCVQGCEHVDCVVTKVMAWQPCGICGEEIGYDRGFYDHSDRSDGVKWKLNHSVCEEERADAGS